LAGTGGSGGDSSSSSLGSVADASSSTLARFALGDSDSDMLYEDMPHARLEISASYGINGTYCNGTGGSGGDSGGDSSSAWSSVAEASSSTLARFALGESDSDMLITPTHVLRHRRAMDSTDRTQRNSVPASMCQCRVDARRPQARLRRETQRYIYDKGLPANDGGRRRRGGGTAGLGPAGG